MAPALDSSDLTWRPVPLGTYDAMQRAMVRHGHAQGGYVLCDRDLPPLSAEWALWTPFTVLVTPQEQALVVQAAADLPGMTTKVDLGLTCQGAVIAEFLQALAGHMPDASPLRSPLTDVIHTLTQPAPGRDSTGLLLSLLPLLMGEVAPAPVPPKGQGSPAIALERQQAQDFLLNQVITKIRESLDLGKILATTAAEVRHLLAADRLLIYQFQGDPLSSAQVPGATVPAMPLTGTVRYESCGTGVAGLAGEKWATDCAIIIASRCYINDEGQPQVAGDSHLPQGDAAVQAAWERLGIQAQMIAPIVIREHLWGVLWVQQCQGSRTWQIQERQFVQHIAEHLGVAIQQAELYRQIRDQAESLEACVIAQTQGLRDAMIAAQAANRTKSEFLAAMSHELRTPLTCIIGLSATLLRWSFGDLSPRQREYLTTIHNSGERLLSLINDILELSKIESGRTVLEVAPLSLSQLAHQCWEAFRAEARDRAIDLTYDTVALTDQDTFIGDARRIRQIISNLLSNALKFTEVGGQVNLRLRWEQQTIVFQVEDTGIGIPQDQQSLLFETFQQLEGGHRRQYQGTGLGLALTKQLVELHGGTITVHSRLGVGSVFTVRLPQQRLEGRDRLPLKPAEATPEPVAGRIVLVEDREETARVICDLLTSADYQVIWMIEGSRVIEQVALLQPSVIIVNLQLAGVDGQHIVRDLRESLVTDHVRILGLLGERPESTTDHSITDTIDAVLANPLDPEQLLEQVNALMAIATP
ncbi:MAG: ATP-binding protein [Cyanobacteria bacterium]|nr:ATP-binding protein [Cyanobacteriota bacterium]